MLSQSIYHQGMPRAGTKDRIIRRSKRQPGTATNSSADFLMLVSKLYKHSDSEARLSRRNKSDYVYAGLPLLLAALQAFVVEFEFLIPAKPSKPIDINDAFPDK